MSIAVSTDGVGSGLYNCSFVNLGAGLLLDLSPQRLPWEFLISGCNFTDSIVGAALPGISFTPVPVVPAASFPANLPPTPHYLLTIVGSLFSNIQSATFGAVYVDGPGDLVVTDSIFRDCGAIYGPAIMIYKGRQLQITRCTFERNFAAEAGAVYRGPPHDDTYLATTPPSLLISDSIFSSNTAGSGGAAVVLGYAGIPGYNPCLVYITGSAFTTNEVRGSLRPTNPQVTGGAILFTGPAYPGSTIDSCDFVNNSASSTDPADVVVVGGAIYWAGPYLDWTVSNCLFEGNYVYSEFTATSGGALQYTLLMIQGHTFSIQDTIFRDNHATGLYLADSRSVTSSGAVGIIQAPDGLRMPLQFKSSPNFSLTPVLL